MNKWWGYKHVNGEILVKRFWDYGDIDEARRSDFVKSVTWVFDAIDFNDAMRQAKEILE